ncbi:hypothetical protein, partial [Treponema saccharophilum]|uniref:hypothetical protein n=1 Tax=Treponema saccharophilum TaxID=165 RepID=UPI003863F02E
RACRLSDCSDEAELGTGKGLAIENGKNCNRPAPVVTEARRACRLSDCSNEAELRTGKGLAIENGKRFAISQPAGHGGTFSCRSNDCSKEAELRTGKDLQFPRPVVTEARFRAGRAIALTKPNLEREKICNR